MHFGRRLRGLDCKHGRVGTDGTGHHHHTLHWKSHPHIHLELRSLHQPRHGKEGSSHSSCCLRGRMARDRYSQCIPQNFHGRFGHTSFHSRGPSLHHHAHPSKRLDC